MKKIMIAFAILAVALVGIGIVDAYSFGSRMNNAGNDVLGQTDNAGTYGAGCPYHNDMENIFETGTYQDLTKYRAEKGVNMMPWVNSEDTFKLAKEHHELMDNGQGCQGRGMMGNAIENRIGNGAQNYAQGSGIGRGGCHATN